MALENTKPDTFSAFSEARCLAQSSLSDAALAARSYLDQHPARRALTLQDSTCRPVDLDMSGDEDLLVRKAEHLMVTPPATADRLGNQPSDHPAAATLGVAIDPG